MVVFDLDGTLVDSRRDLAESINQTLIERGASLLDEDTIGRMVGDGAATLVRRAFEAAGLPGDPEALHRFLTIYNGRLLKHTRPYPGVSEVLAALQCRAALAVLTNKPAAATAGILEGLDLARYFPAPRVCGGDGPIPRKPAPDGLFHLAATTGVAVSATLLVGDSPVDWQTARAAACPVCLARYGFGFEGFPPADVASAEHVIDAPSELLAIV